MNVKKSIAVSLWLLFAACATDSYGLTNLVSATVGSTTRTNTVITSDRLTFYYERQIAVFEDNVVVRDPELTIASDRLTVLFQDNSEVKSATAVGDVKISQGDKNGSCDKAIYLSKTGEIILSGNATLRRDKDYVAGDTITFWVNEDKMTCEPGHLVITPEGDRDTADLLGGGEEQDE